MDDHVVPRGTRREKVLTCSVYRCTSISTQVNPPEFYHFPRELERCSVWVRRCSKPEVLEVFRKQGTRKLHFQNRICSEHFHDRDFKNPKKKTEGLRRDAVPSRNFQQRLSESRSISDCSIGSYALDSESEHSDTPMSMDIDIDERLPPLVSDASSESSVDVYLLKEDGTPNEEGAMLMKRLIDNERKNSRLKRALQRMNRLKRRKFM